MVYPIDGKENHHKIYNVGLVFNENPSALLNLANY